MPPLGPHPMQKSSWKMQRQPQTLRCVPRILVSLSPICVSRDFGLLWNQNCCISRDFGNQTCYIFPAISVCCGTKTAVFSRDFALLWNQNCCIFKGFWVQNYCVFQDCGPHVARTILFCRGLGPHGARTTVFSRDFKSSWCQSYCILQDHRTKTTLFSKIWSKEAEARLKDHGVHAWVIFYFNSSLQKKSA